MRAQVKTARLSDASLLVPEDVGRVIAAWRNGPLESLQSGKANALHALASNTLKIRAILSVNPLRFIPRFRLLIRSPNGCFSWEDEPLVGRPLRVVDRRRLQSLFGS